MSAVRGIFRNGQVVLTSPPPADWVDGTEIWMDAGEPPGEGDPQPDDPESIAEWLAWLDTLKPFMTPEEDAEWRRVQAEDRAWEMANWDKECKKIEDLFK